METETPYQRKQGTRGPRGSWRAAPARADATAIDVYSSVAIVTDRHAIAREARSALGRPMHRGSRVPDWDAWHAIAAAARASGYDQPLMGYVTDAQSLRAAARDYLARYGEAYGVGSVPAGASPQADAQALASIARTVRL